MAALVGPGPFRTQGHGDINPTNWIWSGEALRAVDCEWGGFRELALRGELPGVKKARW